MEFKEILWLFREPRTGSSWLNIKLSKILNRERNFLDDKAQGDLSTFFLNRSQQDSDYNQILSTHYFKALESLKNYKDPILIRTLRKNRVEQFLSQYLGMYTELKYRTSFEENITMEPVIVPKSRAIAFIELSKENDKLWDMYSNYYRNETVYYEDLLQGHNFTHLPIPTIGMDLDTDELPKKIPYNKKELVLNYNQLETLFLDHFSHQNVL